MAKKEEEFTIPEKFISQLEEFSNGGFFLLTFSSLGNVIVHHYAETQKDEIAIKAALQDQVNAMHMIEEEGGELVEDDSDEDEKAS